MGIPNIGISSYVFGSHIDYPGYSAETATFELTHSPDTPVTVHNISVHDRLLLHWVNQVLIPKVNKSNNPTALEIFYMWCIYHSFHINLGYTICCHMKSVISRSYYELPYGMLITCVALVNGVDLFELESGKTNPRAHFDKKLLDSMGIRKVKGIWLKKDEEVLESSTKPKRIKTRVVKKTPFRRGRRLATIKEGGDKSLEEQSASTKDLVPPTPVDIEVSDDVDMPQKNPSHVPPALSLSLEEDDVPAPGSPVHPHPPTASGPALASAPASPPPAIVASYPSLNVIFQEAENRFRAIVREEIAAALSSLHVQFSVKTPES